MCEGTFHDFLCQCCGKYIQITVKRGRKKRRGSHWAAIKPNGIFNGKYKAKKVGERESLQIFVRIPTLLVQRTVLKINIENFLKSSLFSPSLAIIPFSDFTVRRFNGILAILMHLFFLYISLSLPSPSVLNKHRIHWKEVPERKAK